jgi:hypothetical protein
MPRLEKRERKKEKKEKNQLEKEKAAATNFLSIKQHQPTKNAAVCVG